MTILLNSLAHLRKIPCISILKLLLYITLPKYDAGNDTTSGSKGWNDVAQLSITSELLHQDVQDS